jgi:cephalosporin-C deacetylase-like acetyl esterase
MVKLNDGRAEIIGSLNEPGFLRCEVSYDVDPSTRPLTALAGAAIEPEKIAPSLPVPDDFDAFWSQQRKLLLDHPAEPKLTAVASPDDTIETFDVQIAVPEPGRNLSGYFARPKNARPHSLPAILYPHSAGVRDSDLPHAVRGAKIGAIALDFNAHGVPNGQPPEFYAGLLSGDLSGYASRGMEDREQVYFRGMYLRLWRALDFLTQQPEWDGKTLIVEGSSQGGGQALVIAGLDHRITLCLASVPALSDLTAAKIDRTPGWPKMLRRGADGSINPKAIEALRYVDVMNFASRIQCPTIVSVGFIDATCPPTSVYAAFNNIPANVNKTIVNRPAMGHAFPKDLIEEWDEVIRKHIIELRSQGGEDL